MHYFGTGWGPKGGIGSHFLGLQDLKGKLKGAIFQTPFIPFQKAKFRYMSQQPTCVAMLRSYNYRGCECRIWIRLRFGPDPSSVVH